MTKILHLKLNKYEQIFRTAIDSNYYRAMDSRFAAEFLEACKELNIYVNPVCPQCVLRALQALGKLYFSYTEPEQPVSPDSSEKSEDNKTIKTKKKVSQNEPKNKKKSK